MNKSILCEELGLYGWNYLEPVILASLASEQPMLLIGKHGSAKSFILERLAESLKLNYRFYNASLINYDDLVGIPIPINNNTELSYISNKSSIWDAEVVFIDEINRTRFELQNKLFPIIYDKRIQGINLNKLKYRWAAMNPPSDIDDEDYYLGTLPLDPALIDRFTYIINVPSWEDLSIKDKELMLLDNQKGKHELKVDINELINKTKHYYTEILKKYKDVVSKYIVTLMQLLSNSFGYLSSRRAMILEDSFYYLFAASKVVSEYTLEDIDLSSIASLHVLNTLPVTVNKKIDKTSLLAISKQAMSLSKLEDSISKNTLLINDPIERLKYVIKNKDSIDIETLNNIIPSSLSLINDKKIRRAMALFLYISFKSNREIYASNIETLANEIRPILQSKEHKSLENIPNKRCANVVEILMNEVPFNKEYRNYLLNYMNSFLPDKYEDENDVKRVFNFFINTWEELING